MAFGDFSIRRRTRTPLAEPLYPLPEDLGRRFRLRVGSEQRGSGQWIHTVQHEDLTERSIAAFTAGIDLPGEIGALEVLDPFVLMLAFRQMSLGGVLEVDGPVSRRLLRNLADIQAQSCNRWPERYRPFAIEPRTIVESPYAASRRAGGIIAVTGGLDSTLTLYRQTDPRLDQVRYPLALAATVIGYNPHIDQLPPNYEALHTERMKRLCGPRGLDVGVIRTDLSRIFSSTAKPHGAVLGGLFALAAPAYPFALLASSAANGETWIGRGCAPEWQWSYGSGGFELPTDLGFLTRAERVAMLGTYGRAACDDLIVCGEVAKLPENCGRCGKCIRTMLTFEAAGLPMPRAFPAQIDRARIGYGASKQPEIGYYTEILRLARASGRETPNLRLLRRRYLRKALKRKVLDFAAAMRWD